MGRGSGRRIGAPPQPFGMTNVVKFRPSYRAAASVEPRAEPAIIVVLPVVRIERNPASPHDAMVDEHARATGRKRRRRAPVDRKRIPD